MRPSKLARLVVELNPSRPRGEGALCCTSPVVLLPELGLYCKERLVTLCWIEREHLRSTRLLAYKLRRAGDKRYKTRVVGTCSRMIIQHTSHSE